MSTISDVAREAGVSTATVSRILHNSPKVLPETREKVLEVIKRLDYHPNTLARQFRTQKTKTILVIIPELSNTFYHEIISGIEYIAENSGYHVLIAEIHNNENLELYYFDKLTQKQVDGIITFSAKLPSKKLREYTAKFPIVVACRYYVDVDIPNVTINNEKASKDMTNYLLNLGHRNICYLAGNVDIPLYRDRKNGFLNAFEERGLSVDDKLITQSSPSIQEGYNSVTKLLNDGMDFTAIVSGGDAMAIGAIRAIKDHGLSVPEDIAVTGFDDIELASLYSPSLSTVRQPKRQIGIRSMEKLLELIEGKSVRNRQEVLQYELVIRESTGEYIGLE